MAGKS